MNQDIAGFRVVSKTFESARTLVLAAHRRDDGAAVLLKMPQPGQSAQGLDESYERELRYRRELNSHDVSLARHMGMPLLIIRDGGRLALRDLLQSSGPLDLATWLRVAVTTCAQLKRLHGLGVLHRDLHPGNLLWDPLQHEVDIVDFEMAVPLVHAQAAPIDRRQIETALPYMAPEMTGRMNIGVDYRSDLYMLGATLYEMLTGERPFMAEDPLELIHQHMAVDPVPPHHILPDLSGTISAIILKLLEKSPERRYQSARGLERDLRQALDQLQRSDKIDDFTPGANDVADEYRPGSVLYGRERERMEIMDALRHISGDGRCLYFIGGYSGIGKTALARQLREPTLLGGGIYAEGKCDQYQRLQPYSAWSRALDSALMQILTLPERQRELAGGEILRALGANGALLTELVPSLELLIGPQPAVSILSPDEARNRLGYVFAAFMTQLAKVRSPLVIFLDDLQWMDAASLELLQVIAQSQDIHSLLVVGAYRDNEVDGSHPLHLAMQELARRAPRCVSSRRLSNLSADDLARMIAENLRMDMSAAADLAATIHARTGGNPFFSHQLLKQLADSRVLRFEDECSAWTWSASALAQLPLADNVVELLLDRLRALPARTRQLMQLGACVGNRFPVAVLATVAECPETDVMTALEPALGEGLLNHEEFTLRFNHDRIQQAAYNLIEPDERAPLHLKIGRLLLAEESGEIARERLFDIMAHFEQGRALLKDKRETARVASLAADAARRAQAASAHDVALRHYRFALELRGDDGWSADPDAHWTLFLEAIQSEFINAQHARVEAMIHQAVAQVRSRLDRIALFELEIRFAIARNDQNAAIALALEALGRLGFNFALDADGLAEQAVALRRALHVAPEGIAALERLPEMQDPEQLAAMRIMVSAAGAAYVMRPGLWEVLTLTLVRTTLEHGSSPLAAFAYGFYAVLLAGVYQDIDAGYAFGQLSTRLLEQYGAEPLRAKIVNLFDVFVRHWKEHLRNSLDTLPRGLQSGIDHGDFEYGSYNAIQHGKHRVICGYPLHEVLEQQNAYIDVIDRLKMGYHLDFARIWRQLALNLSGRARDPLVLAGDDYDADALIPSLIGQSSNFLVFNIYCSQTMLLYLLGCPDAALERADKAVAYANYVPGMAEIAEHNFFHSLCLLASLRRGEGVHNRAQLRRVAQNQRQLEFWARHAPMNFRHKWALVEAERLRRSAKAHRAAAVYERAIEGARNNWYLNDQALAAELYGEYLLEQGSRFLAATLIREALRLYRAWQAEEKVKQLRARHAALLDIDLERASSRGQRVDVAAVDFDVQSALRASLAIARETDPEALKRELMRIVAENAGAQRGVLALEDEAGWVVAARFGEDGMDLPAELPLKGYAGVPQTVFRHVTGKRETLVLNDLAEAPDFGHDGYLQAHHVRSVLCIPLLQGNRCTGILYLENRATPGAFAPSSVKVIEILASQVIVAIEKVRLLATLEQRVEARTRDLRRAQAQLERANASLASSEERFRLAMRGTSEGLFDWNLSTGELYLSPGWKRMLGFEDHELTNSFETWRQLVHPDDRVAVMNAMDAQLAGDAESFELEHKLRRKDGDWIQVMARGHIVRDSSGMALRIVGSNVDVTAERQAQAAIRHQALHDPLTGLPNRTLFNDRLGAALNELRRNGTPFALHLLDLDRFKPINDSLGHLVGDEVLRQVASRMRALVRDTDTVARLGGDEFAILQAGTADAADARILADKLIASVSEPIEVNGMKIDVGCSIGIRLARHAVADTDVLMREADAALYGSKNAGRSVATVHQPKAVDEARGQAPRLH